MQQSLNALGLQKLRDNGGVLVGGARPATPLIDLANIGQQIVPRHILKIGLRAILYKQFQTMLVGHVGLWLALRRLHFFKIGSQGISHPKGVSPGRLGDFDSGFTRLQFNGFAPGLLQDLGRVLDALPAPSPILIPLDVIIAFGVPFRLAVDQHPIHFELVVLGLGGSKAPFIGDFDVLEDVDPA